MLRRLRGQGRGEACSGRGTNPPPCGEGGAQRRVGATGPIQKNRSRNVAASSVYFPKPSALVQKKAIKTPQKLRTRVRLSKYQMSNVISYPSQGGATPYAHSKTKTQNAASHGILVYVLHHLFEQIFLNVSG